MENACQRNTGCLSTKKKRERLNDDHEAVITWLDTYLGHEYIFASEAIVRIGVIVIDSRNRYIRVFA